MKRGESIYNHNAEYYHIRTKELVEKHQDEDYNRNLEEFILDTFNFDTFIQKMRIEEGHKMIYFKGNYLDGYQHGLGTEIYYTHLMFHGYFDHGKRSGNGIFSSQFGDKYIGQYVENMREGHGIEVTQNCAIYNGQWQKN